MLKQTSLLTVCKVMCLFYSTKERVKLYVKRVYITHILYSYLWNKFVASYKHLHAFSYFLLSQMFKGQRF